MGKIRINRKFIDVHLLRSIMMFSLLSVYDAYLCFDNFRRGNMSIGKLALVCTIMTSVSVMIMAVQRFGKKKVEVLPHIAVSTMCIIYWITFWILLYTGGTNGTSIFLIFASAPVAYFFFNLFYGTVFTSVLFAEIVIYAVSPIRMMGYQYPADYYVRLPLMFLVELTVCWLAQYSTIKAEIKQKKAMEDAKQANEAKTLFLANTSHEIRTPMNSILGFCELILREENLSPTVRAYCQDIQGAGKNLLYVINDILDVSRIEAGDLTISKNDFDPSVLVRDIVNAAMAKKQEKNIEIFVDVEEDIPGLLFGDMARIFQVAMNLVTNAIKYTPEGGVYIKIRVDRAASPMMIISVRDTGIGIEKENLDKIFQSFEQVDSGSDRTIEGAGLGLTLTKKIASLMGGAITAESEPGVGSVFTLMLPVQILDDEPKIKRKNFEGIRAGICIDLNMIHPKMRSICIRTTDALCRILDMKRILLPGQAGFDEQVKDLTHIFVNPVIYEKFRSKFDDLAVKTEIVIIADIYKKTEEYFGKKTVAKPLYTYALSDFLCNEKGIRIESHRSSERKKFTAPTARVLLVDDNDMNLLVETNLMGIYGMKLISATSGQEALDLMDKECFDLVFMDHMMPGMDGVETVKRMRENSKCNKETTVIALTANAAAGAKEMFLANGFQDFLPKPIDVRELDDMLRKHIPLFRICEISDESVTEGDTVEEHADDFSEEAVRIMDESGLIDHGEVERYMADKEIMILYADAYEIKKKELEESYAAGDWKNYRIRVHALKSSSGMVGAVKLRDMAKAAEDASAQENDDEMKKLHPQLMDLYEEVVEVIGRIVRA